MTWVMTSKRTKGSRDNPPYTEFCVGQVKIAEIVMKQLADKWIFILRLFDRPTPATFDSFGEALKHLHSMLNSPAPEGFEIFQGRKK